MVLPHRGVPVPKFNVNVARNVEASEGADRFRVAGFGYIRSLITFANLPREMPMVY